MKCDACGDVGDGAEKVFPAAEQQEDSLETELFECSTTPSLPPVLRVRVCLCASVCAKVKTGKLFALTANQKREPMRVERGQEVEVGLTDFKCDAEIWNLLFCHGRWSRA